MNNETFRRKYRRNVHDLGLGKVFLDLVTKSTTHKRKKNDKLDFTKMKTFCLFKDTRRMKSYRQGESIFKSPTQQRTCI